MSSLEKRVFRFFAYFVVRLLLWLLSCMSSWYTLYINCLSNPWFKNIFSHLKGWLFTLWIVPIAVEELLSYDVVHLSILAFVLLPLMLYAILAKTSAKELFTYVFFQVFCYLRSYIQVFNQFSVKFCEWCKIRVQYSFIYECRVFLTLIEETIISQLHIIGPLVEDFLTIYVWIYSGLFILFI